MNVRNAFFILVLVFVVATQGVFAKTKKPSEFAIRDLIERVSTETGQKFVVDPQVRGRISFVVNDTFNKEDWPELLRMALQINGLSIVPDGKYQRVMTSRNVQRDGIPVMMADGSIRGDIDRSVLITRIFKLKHVDASDVNRFLRILPSKDGEMVVFPQVSAVIVSDYRTNIERVATILEALDTEENASLSGMEVIHLKKSKAKEVAKSINRLFGVESRTISDREGHTKHIPGTPLIEALRRTNSVVIKANPVKKAEIIRAVKEIEAAPFRFRGLKGLWWMGLIAIGGLVGFLLARSKASQ